MTTQLFFKYSSCFTIYLLPIHLESLTPWCINYDIRIIADNSIYFVMMILTLEPASVDCPP